MIHLIFCNISEYSCDTYPRPNHDMTGFFKLWRMLDALTSGVPTQFLSTVNQPTFSTWPNYTTRRGFWTTALALCVFLSVYFLKFATFVHDCSLSCGPSMREVVLAPPVKKTYYHHLLNSHTIGSIGSIGRPWPRIILVVKGSQRVLSRSFRRKSEMKGSSCTHLFCVSYWCIKTCFICKEKRKIMWNHVEHIQELFSLFAPVVSGHIFDPLLFAWMLHFILLRGINLVRLPTFLTRKNTQNNAIVTQCALFFFIASYSRKRTT